ncbi:class I SAM-dependent methyltransferase [Patescibacteria group bacterium]
MEERKQKEIEYYDRSAERILKESSRKKWEGDFEGFNPLLLESFQYCYTWLSKNSKNKVILDFGCGNGIHSVLPAKSGAKKVIGIDLSEESLKLARERIKREKLEDNVEFLSMDCEKLNFPNNSFDIIFDGGTFSSLDLKKTFPELARVLKSDGYFLGIETFGHNFFTNLKRKINKLIGKRTQWAEEHILKMNDLKFAKNYFNKIEIQYFHLISWMAFPFLKLPGGKYLLKFLETIDKVLLKASFFKKYSFKVVFILSDPKKQ